MRKGKEAIKVKNKTIRHTKMHNIYFTNEIFLILCPRLSATKQVCDFSSNAIPKGQLKPHPKALPSKLSATPDPAITLCSKTPASLKVNQKGVDEARGRGEWSGVIPF